MQHKFDLTFGIFDYSDITHEAITQLLGITPYKIYIKGERVKPRSLFAAKENAWIMKASEDTKLSLEDHLNLLIDVIESKRELFKRFCDSYYCEISCAVILTPNSDESTPSLHLGDRYNNLIRNFNIEFDLDLYTSSNKQ